MEIVEAMPRNRIRWALPEPEAKPVARAPPFMQRLKLCLVDGELEVDGQKIRVPVGIGKYLTGSGIKALCQKYKGLLLFFRTGENWQRVGDNEVLELTDDTKLKTERPVVRTAPRFHAD